MVRTLSALKRRRPASFFFFSPKRRRSETAPTYFCFSLLYGVVLPSLKITLLKPFLISQSLSTLTCLCLSQKSLSNPHTLKSQSLPRAVALSQLSLSPSRCRTSQLSLFVTLSSHFVAQPLSRVAVAAQPRSQLPRRRHTSAQVFYLWYYQYQRFRVAVNTFSLFFLEFFFFWVWPFGNFCVWLCHLLIYFGPYIFIYIWPIMIVLYFLVVIFDLWLHNWVSRQLDLLWMSLGSLSYEIINGFSITKLEWNLG